MQAHDIFKALKSVFRHPAHTLLSEVRNGTGFTRGPRTADALVVSNYPSRGLWLAGVEIKLYLGDWKRELDQPEKAEAIQRYCHYWYVAAPEGLIPQGQLPETWGLIEVGPKKNKIVVKAPWQEPKPIDMLLLASILRNVAESHVSKAQLHELADEKAKKLAEHRSQELKDLREKIRTFEKESGVTIGESWTCGDIGKAVKIIVESGITHRTEFLKRLRTQAADVVDSCDKIAAALKQETIYEVASRPTGFQIEEDCDADD